MRSKLRAWSDWFYEMFSRCPAEHDGRWRDRDVMIVAHRGAACEHPENTLASLEAALVDHRCTALEIDLSITRDGEVVLWHDWDPTESVSIARQNGFEEDVLCRPFAPDSGSKWLRPVHDLGLEDLRRHYGYCHKEVGSVRLDEEIPTLAEFFAWAATRSELRHVHLDIKIPPGNIGYVEPMFDRIEALIAEHKPAFNIIYSTPFLPVFEAMDRRSRNPNYAFDVEAPFGVVLRPTRLSSVRTSIRYKKAFATSVHPKVTTLAPWTTYKRIIRADVKFRERHNRRGPEVPIERVFAATFNERDLIRCLVAMGVDGLITDCPDIVREEVERSGREWC